MNTETIPGIDDETYLGGRARSVFYVLSGPGGTGKSTLIQRWRKDDPTLGYVLNYTTRSRRPPDEQSGIDDRDWFHFIDTKEFQRLVREDFFVQWSHAAKGYLSGTPIAPLRAAIEEGRDLVFDYTPQLYLNLRRLFRRYVVGIFVVPPTLKELARRIQGRGSETSERFRMKFEMGRQDLAYMADHDYLLVNEDIETTLSVLKAIRVAEKTRMGNLEGLEAGYSRVAPNPMLFYYDPFGARVAEIHSETGLKKEA